MGAKNARVDAYIADAPDYAKPILTHLRELVHKACPDVREEMKWSRPHFNREGMLCGMSAFKEHCAFGFWKWDLIFGKVSNPPISNEEAMGQFGRITSLKDLPKDSVIIECVKAAVKLNESGVKLPPRPRSKVKKPVAVPKFLADKLRGNPKAKATFDNFSPSHQREYVEWLEGAKRDETRERRLETAMAWLTEGKPRNWKHEKC